MTPLGWAIPNNLSNSGCLIISIWARLSAFQARHTCWTGYPEPSLPSSWSLMYCSFWPEQLLLLKRLHVAKTRVPGQSALTSTLSDAKEKNLPRCLILTETLLNPSLWSLIIMNICLLYLHQMDFDHYSSMFSWSHAIFKLGANKCSLRVSYLALGQQLLQTLNL